MKIPVIRGVIDRRILVNYRVEPGAIAALLPAPFAPKLVRGKAIAGICLIRLKNIRPRFVPLSWGIRSENAAHRIAVTWEQDGRTHEGVFIPRRDTDSRLNSLAGGRLFPGLHHHARFDVSETDDHLSIDIKSDDRQTRVHVEARVADRLPASSLFDSLEEASAFFEAGALGYSVTADPERFDGLELHCHNWHVQPLDVERVTSSFFDDVNRFPPGTVEFDNALLMRGIDHEWHSRGDLCCPESTVNVV